MTRLEAEVYNAAGTIQGEGPITTIQSASVSRVLDGPGEVRLVVPTHDARVQDLIDNERRLHVYCYHPDGTRRLLGIGIPRRLSAGEAAESSTLALDGPDQLDELRRVNTRRARIYDGTALPSVLSGLIALVSGWSADTTGTPADLDVYARFDGCSVLKALQEVCKRYGLHMRWDSSKHVDIGPLGDTAPIRIMQSGSRLPYEAISNTDVCWIERLQWVDDTEAVANHIEPLGGGQGEAVLTLEHATRGTDRYETTETNGAANYSNVVGLKDAAARSELAQAFQIGAETWIGRVQLYIEKVGTVSSGTLTLRVETDNGGDPSGNLVDAAATATINCADVTTDIDWNAFTFTTGFYLAGSTTYHLRLSTSRSVDAANYIAWGYGGTYADGYIETYDTVSWTPGGEDAIFMVEEIFDARTTATIAENLETTADCSVTLQSTGIPYEEVSYAGGTATASSTLAGFSPDNAFDNDYDDPWWTDSSTTGWLKMALASAQTIYQYRVHVGNVTSTAHPKDWILKYSDDDITYNNADTQSGIIFTGSSLTFTLASPTLAQYWMIDVSANNGHASLLGIQELDLKSLFPHEALAQSFQSTAAVRIEKVRCYMSKVGSPTGNLTIEVQGDSGGDPDSSAITNGTSGNVAASTLAVKPGWVEFTFATPPYIAATTTYWLVLQTSDSASATNFVVWYADKTSPGYGSGVMKSYDGAAWDAESKDACFQVLAQCEVYPYAVQNTTGPDGSTYYYLTDSDSITAYGQIEKILKVDISPLSNSNAAITDAANALYDAASAWLQRYSVKQTTYSASLVGAYSTLLPGMKVHVTYKGMVTDAAGNDVTWRDIDGWYWIISATETVDASGFKTQVELSDVDRTQETITELIVGAMEAVQLSNIVVKPYPTTNIYCYTDTIASGSLIYIRDPGTLDGGKNARFNILIDDSIVYVSRVTIRVRTHPLSTNTIIDHVNTGDDADILYSYYPTESDHYPADLSISIDGTDRTGALGGPWGSTTDFDEQLDFELDITDYICDGTFPGYGNHEIVISSGGRDISTDEDIAVSAYATHNVPDPGPSPAGGVVELTVSIFCVTQAIKLT